MRDKARLILGALAVFVVLGVLLLSLFLLAYGYLADPSAFNSDNLLSCVQCDDLLHGRDLSGWHLPGAPYFFPDLLILAPCQALSPTTPISFVSYCFLLHLGTTAVLFWLGCLTGLSRRTALIASCCGVVLLAAMNCTGSHDGRNFLLVHPGSHVAVLVVGLFLLAMTLRAVLRSPSWLTSVLFVAVGSMGIFSDQLLLVQFLAPTAAALIFLAIRRTISFKRAGGQLALLGVSVVLAFAIKMLFEQLGFHFLVVDTSFGKPHFPDLFRMLRFLYHGVAGDHLLCVLIVLQFLALLLVAYFQGRRPAEPAEELGLSRSAILLTAFTFLLSPLCIIATLFIAGMSHQAAIGRYTLSIWFLPALLLPMSLCWLPGRTARLAATAVRLAIVLFAVQRAAMLLPGIDRAKFEQPYPPLAQALDHLARERGPLRGLAGFWSARSTTWFACENVVVNALSPQGEPWFHASNAARFLADDNKLHMPKYQFLAIRPGEPFTPSPAVLTLHFGEPKEKINVGGGQIWLYDSLRTPPFEHFLRSRLAERLRRLRPFTGPIEPICLARPKANMTPLDDADNISLESHQTQEVRFARPISGKLLDIGASFDSRFDVDFYRGAERLGELFVPSVPWAGGSYQHDGIQSRLLSIPSSLRERGWDRIVVRPRPNCINVRLAHVLVFADSVPGLDEERSAPRPTCLRFEAEELFPLNPGTPYSDDADPSASGGRIRRAAVDYRCLFNFTPRLYLPPGRYRLNFAVKIDDNSDPNELVNLAVNCVSPMTSLASRSLRGQDFPAAGRFATHTLTFEVGEDMDGIQFGIASAGKSPVSVDYVDLIGGRGQGAGGSNSILTPDP